jgi:5-methylcytosine-specific restriction endonuclease McrA
MEIRRSRSGQGDGVLGLPAWLVEQPAVTTTSDWHGTTLRLAAARKGNGQLGRFGIGIKLAMAGVLLDEAPPSESSYRSNVSPPVTDDDLRAVEDALARRRASALPQLGGDSAEGTQKVQGLRAEPFAPVRMRATTTTRRASYGVLCRRIEEWERTGKSQDRRGWSGDRRVRSTDARRAVLWRSERKCENPQCPMPVLPDVSKAGEPLLEVDHIDNHAEGGRDHPAAMIALCPNCHKIKTLGRTGPALAERLRVVARRLHQDWSASSA